MLVYNGNYPLVGVAIDKEQNRIPFKYRIITDGGQFFTVNSTGLKDVGHELLIATPRNVEKASHIVLDGIHYSVKRIKLWVPDRAMESKINRKINAEYWIDLG